MWLDAGDASTFTFSSGSNISQWKDKSGNGLYASPSNGGSGIIPTYSNSAVFINNGGSSTYNSSTYTYLRANSNFQTGSNFTIFAVFNFTTTSIYQAVFENFNSTSGSNEIRVIGNTQAFDSDTSNNVRMIQTFSLGTTRSIVSFLESPSGIYIYQNGSIIGSNKTAITVGYDSAAAIGIGGGQLNNRWATGYFNEIICYNALLTTGQQQQIEGYLGWKWGLNTQLIKFSPLNISNCKLWIDASDSSSFTKSGSSITAVTDKSGNSVSLGSSSGYSYVSNFNTSYPSFYQPTSYGSGLIGSNSSFTVAQPFTLFFVGRTLSNIGFVMDEPNNRVGISMQAVPNGYQIGQSGSYMTGDATTFYSPMVLTCIFNGGSSTIRTNGSVLATGNMGGSGFTGTIVVGARYSSTNAWNGYFSEYLIYSGALSSNQIQQMESYLSSKWGITISNYLAPPSSHPFTKLPPSTAAFNPKTISGISLWLDAADTSTITLSSGSNISQWNDKSGNNRNATGINTPTYSSSNIVMNGSSYFNVNLDFLAGNSHFAFIVCSNTNYVNIYGATTGGNGSNSLHIGFRDSTSYRMNYWGNDWYQNFVNYQANKYNILGYFWNYNASKTIYANGSLEGSTSQAGTPGTMSGGGTIGNVVGQGVFQGNIQEILFYTSSSGSPVNMTNQQQIEGYLAWKWGLQGNLPSTHPYKKGAP